MNIFISNSTDIFAGGEDYVVILAKYLQKRGHRVWVSANPGHLLLRKCDEVGIGTVPVGYTGMSRVFNVAAEVRRHLQTLSIDVIHSNANYDRTVAGIAAAWSRTKHVASVHSAHSIQHNITHWLRNRFGIDHFIADAEAVKNVLVAEDGVKADHVTVIPIGVENFPKDDEVKWRGSTRSSWGVSEQTCVLGNVARLVPFKGHRYLIEAIAEVAAVVPDVLCVIVGDGDLKSQLQQQMQTMGLEHNIRFLGFQDNLHEIYPAFDIYCHSSLEREAEAFPLAILRALASGLPVVATRVGGIGLMVEEGKTGYLSMPEDVHAIAESLLRVTKDPGLRLSLGKASFELFTRKFHASAMAEQVEKVYLSTLYQ